MTPKPTPPTKDGCKYCGPICYGGAEHNARVEDGAVMNSESSTEPKPECKKCCELAMLLVECRDALPAISLSSARLRGISLTLADRIEESLKPWEVHDGTGI
jgi:hypothetical protein